MQAAALYRWSVKGSPVEILIDLACVDRLRESAGHSTVEIGGLLLGHIEDGQTIISDFELIESEHRRGAAYTLTNRDEARLQSRVQFYRRKPAVEIAGFFRSHRRPGLYLDESDNHCISSYFTNPSQVVLLVRPAAAGEPEEAAVGGFFFWEDGEMNRKQTYRSFPMNSQALALEETDTVSEGSVVLPSAKNQPSGNGHQKADDFGNAETLYQLAPAEKPSASKSGATVSNGTIAVSKRRNWMLVAGIAGGAAFGGYLIGTTGHKDAFGSRSGDIAFAPTAAPSQPVSAPTVTPAPTPATSSAAVDTPIAPVPEPDATSTSANQAGTPAPVTPTSTSEPSVKPTQSSPNSLLKSKKPALRKAPTPPQPDEYDALPAYTVDHRPPPPPSAPVETARALPEPAPAPSIPTPVIAAPKPPVAEATVFLEAGGTGGFRKAFGRLMFGRSREEGFVPPQAVKSFAPHVPNGLAHELTGTLPVDLRLKVDRTGRVSSVEILSRQVPPEFVRLAGEAAYDWHFEPARVKDKAVSSEVVAHFKFRPVL